MVIINQSRQSLLQLLWWYSDAISSLTLCCVNLKRKLVVLFIVEADGSFDGLIAHVKCLAEPPIPLMSCSLSMTLWMAP